MVSRAIEIALADTGPARVSPIIGRLATHAGLATVVLPNRAAELAVAPEPAHRSGIDTSDGRRARGEPWRSTACAARTSAEYNGRMERDLKEEAKRVIDNLPSLSSWEDLMYQIYVREAIEHGLADSREGRKTPVEDVRAEFGLPE